jgi:molybdenum cofactor cytidylyltransferase
MVGKVFLSSQASSRLMSLSLREHFYLSRAISQLGKNPESGLRLWGSQGLYLYQTATDSKIVYRMSGAGIQVLSIKAAEEPRRSPRERDKISAIVLAGGRADYSDSLPISFVTEALLHSGIDDLIVVVGNQHEQAKKTLRNQDVKIIVNPDCEHGLSKSLRYGLKMVSRDSSAVLLSLGNRPFITSKVVDKLIKTYRQEKASVVVPTYSQMRGHPVIFNTLLIPELLRARGDIGGRQVLRQHRRELKQVEMEDAGVLERIWEQ